LSKYSRLGKNTLFIFIGSAGSKLIGLLMLPFYTRVLSPENYGTVDLIYTYVQLLVGIVSFYITDAIFVFSKDCTREKQNSYFTSGSFFLLISLTSAFLLFKFISLFAAYTNILSEFEKVKWFVYGLLVSQIIQLYVQQFARSIDSIIVYSITGLVVVVCTAVFSFVVVPKYGVFGYVSALAVANLAAALYSIVFSKSFKYIDIKKAKLSSCREMLRFSVPLVPIGLMNWMTNGLSRPIIAEYLGIHSLGIFAVANKFALVVQSVFTIFEISWQSSALEEYQNEGYACFFNRVLRLITASLLFLFFGSVLFSKIIVRLFTTSEFYTAAYYIPLLILVVIIKCMNFLVGSNIYIRKKSMLYFVMAVGQGIASVVLFYTLIPRLAIMGVALSMILISIIGLLLQTAVVWRWVKITNIVNYLESFSCCAAVLVIDFYAASSVVKYSSIILLLGLYVFFNRDLYKDAALMFKLIRNRFLSAKAAA